jgi:glycopeptide antibiotics resistance protein
MISTRLISFPLFLYLLFIVYGSLFPLVDWSAPQHGLFEVWLATLVKPASCSDLLTNAVAYIPVGFLLQAVFTDRSKRIVSFLLTVLIGFSLSFLLEYIQLYLPARTSSPIDLLMNTLSTMLGAVVFFWLRSGAWLGDRLQQWRHKQIIAGRIGTIGIAVIGLWGAVQLAPFVPSLDIGDIRYGLKQLWLTLHDISRFNGYRAVTYTLNIAALGAVLHLILYCRNRTLHLLWLLGSVVFLCKIFIAGRQLSLEALVGLAVGGFTALFFRRMDSRTIPLTGVCLVIAAFVADEMRPDLLQVSGKQSFNWIPFASQLQENVTGISSILGGLWPFVAAGFFVLMHNSVSERKISTTVTCMVLAGVVFIFEYLQTYIVGRYPDSTTVLLGVVGWLVVIWYGKPSEANNKS